MMHRATPAAQIFRFSFDGRSLYGSKPVRLSVHAQVIHPGGYAISDHEALVSSCPHGPGAGVLS
jgi:hypothetical protein